MALETMQPVGDLCDLLGISRFAPGVFDAMVELLTLEGEAGAGREARLADLSRRMTRGR